MNKPANTNNMSCFFNAYLSSAQDSKPLVGTFLEVSKNGVPPKSSISRYSMMHHPFMAVSIHGNPHICQCSRFRNHHPFGQLCILAQAVNLTEFYASSAWVAKQLAVPLRPSSFGRRYADALHEAGVTRRCGDSGRHVIGPQNGWFDMGISINGGTPKSSVLIGFSIINHPLWGTPIDGPPHKVYITWFDSNIHQLTWSIATLP